jgi:hypothetical protein
MYCSKQNCNLNVTTFDASKNEDNDCIIHLVSEILDHYTAMKEKIKSEKTKSDEKIKKLKRKIIEMKEA